MYVLWETIYTIVDVIYLTNDELLFNNGFTNYGVKNEFILWLRGCCMCVSDKGLISYGILECHHPTMHLTGIGQHVKIPSHKEKLSFIANQKQRCIEMMSLQMMCFSIEESDRNVCNYCNRIILDCYQKYFCVQYSILTILTKGSRALRAML